MDFGERLRQRRVAAGLTQTELGKLIDISRQAVAKLEAGESKNLAVLNAIALAKLWGISVEELVLGRAPIAGAQPPGGWQARLALAKKAAETPPRAAKGKRGPK